MKDLTKETHEVIDEAVEYYKDTLEEIFICKDIKSEAERIAWLDWSCDLLVERHNFSFEQAKTLVIGLEEEYKLNKRKDD